MIGNIEEQGRVDDKRLRIVVIGGGFAGLNFVKHVDIASRLSIRTTSIASLRCFTRLRRLGLTLQVSVSRSGVSCGS